MSLKSVRDTLNTYLQNFLSLDIVWGFGGFDDSWEEDTTWGSAITEVPDVVAPIPVGWENVSFTPDTSKSHFRVNFIPANSVATARFKSAMVRETGIYQIDVYTPLDRGTITNDTLVGALRVYFKRGTSLTTVNDTPVYIAETPRVSQSRREGPFYRSTIEVEWVAHFSQP